MGLPPVGQPPEDNCYNCFYACKAAVRIKVGLELESIVGLGLAFGLDLRLGLVSGLYKVAILSCNCEATQTRRGYLFTLEMHPLAAASRSRLFEPS